MNELFDFISKYKNNFKNNKKSLRIIIDESLYTTGIYDDSKNLIVLREKNRETLIHELLHVSSRYKMRVGFYFKFKDYIGYSLNEGYTELLTERCLNRSTMYYPIEKSFASFIESLVTKDRMQEYYFEGRLDKLIKGLLKYDELDNIIYVIGLLDKYTMTKKKCYLNEAFDITKDWHRPKHMKGIIK